MIEQNLSEPIEIISSIAELNSKLVCDIYKTIKSNIANINVPKIENSLPYFIFIVDQSGSMTGYFRDIITNYIPNCLKSLNYPPEKTCCLITFSNDASSSNLNTNDFFNSDLDTIGGTWMNGIFDELEKKFEELKSKNEKMLRILAISDGEIFDQEETKIKGDKFYKKYEGQFKINAQSIRLKTSYYANPDTEALSSILQLSDFFSKLIEIKEKDISSLTQIMVDLFKNDNLCGGELLLVSDKNNLKIYPWQQNAESKIQLNPDINNIFIENEVKNLKIERNDEKCDLNIKVHLDIKYKFENIVTPKTLEVIKQKVRINKIINTPQTKEENKKIIQVISEFKDDDSKIDEKTEKTEKTEKAEKNETNFFDSLKEIENTEQEKIYQLNNDSKAIFIDSKNSLKKIDDLIVNKNSLEEIEREKESKMIMLTEIQNSLTKSENNQNTKDFSDFSNPNIEENIKKENEEKTKMMEKVMNSLTKISMDLNADFSEIADEKIKENIEKSKKEFAEKIGNIVNNLAKIEIDLCADFSQVKNKNIVEMIEKQKEERQKMMREKIENLKKINVDLKADFCDFKNEYIEEYIKKQKEEQLKIVNDAKENLIAGDGTNDGTTAFSEFENKNITEYIRKENEEKAKRLDSARNSLKISDVEDWKNKDMNKFENKNITEQIQYEKEKNNEKLNTARDSLKSSNLILNQNTFEQIKQQKEEEEQLFNELKGALKRRNTVNLVANFSDIKSSNPQKDEPKIEFKLKKIGVDLNSDFSSYSTNSGKEDSKEIPLKISLKKVVTNQNENSWRRNSAASENAFFAKIKLKKIGS